MQVLEKLHAQLWSTIKKMSRQLVFSSELLWYISEQLFYRTFLDDCFFLMYVKVYITCSHWCMWKFILRAVICFSYLLHYISCFSCISSLTTIFSTTYLEALASIFLQDFCKVTLITLVRKPALVAYRK